MLLDLTKKELGELEDLKDIFKDCYVNDIRVECFDLIYKLISNKMDENTISLADKRFLINQLMESKEWLLGLNCNVDLIKKLIKCFNKEC